LRFELFIAKKFLAGQHFGVFRLVTTIIAMSGIALGVAALLITLAVMDGFRSDIQEKILGTQPHVFLANPFGGMIPEDAAIPDQVRTVPHVQGAAPFIYGQALLQSGSSVTGIMLRGIDPDQETHVTEISRILTEGHWSDLDNHGVALGQELARSVSAHLGDVITLVAPEEKMTSWNQVPRMRRYKVVGIFRSGMYEYDANLAYLTLGGAQDLLGLGHQITGFGIRLDTLDATAPTMRKLNEMFGNLFLVRSWQDLNRNLFSAMKLERTMMFIIVTLIILVASFTIISNLLLLTIEKAGEIGILQALGASPRQIARIFLFNGFMLGGGGVGFGLLLGIGISAFLKRFPIIKLPADVYYVDKLPIKLSGSTIESVALCAFGLVLASILYPARKASQMDPVQAIRYG
jgi:lipoprotein-releasing system permease protein